jgi:hypothetical protein
LYLIPNYRNHNICDGASNQLIRRIILSGYEIQFYKFINDGFSQKEESIDNDKAMVNSNLKDR